MALEKFNPYIVTRKQYDRYWTTEHITKALGIPLERYYLYKQSGYIDSKLLRKIEKLFEVEKGYFSK